jgi:proteasome beta subunit
LGQEAAARIEREEAVSIALRALDTAAESDTSTGGVDRGGKIYPIIKIVSREGITTLPESKIAAVFKETVA